MPLGFMAIASDDITVQKMRLRVSFQIIDLSSGSVTAVMTFPVIWAAIRRNPQIQPPWIFAHIAKRIGSHQWGRLEESHKSSKAIMKKEMICGRGPQIGAAARAHKIKASPFVKGFPLLRLDNK